MEPITREMKSILEGLYNITGKTYITAIIPSSNMILYNVVRSLRSPLRNQLMDGIYVED